MEDTTGSQQIASEAKVGAMEGERPQKDNIEMDSINEVAFGDKFVFYGSH